MPALYQLTLRNHLLQMLDDNGLSGADAKAALESSQHQRTLSHLFKIWEQTPAECFGDLEAVLLPLVEGEFLKCMRAWLVAHRPEHRAIRLLAKVIPMDQLTEGRQP